MDCSEGIIYDNNSMVMRIVINDAIKIILRV